MIKQDLPVSLENATREDLEAYVTALHNGEYKSRYGTAYSGSTKADLKMFIKAYLKWLRTDDEEYPPEVRWIKTRIAKDEAPEEKEVVTINEVMTLANSFNKPHMKYVTLLLFDSGFRIQELLSVKKKDLEWDTFEGDRKCFWLHCNESKTEKRRIPLLLFEEEYRDFMNSTYVTTKNPNDLLFPYEYSAVLRGLKRRSKQALGKEITPHHLRHSSATFYAKEYEGNMLLLADRYGWTYSSDQLKRYIRRSGTYQRQGAKKVYENEVIKLRGELAEKGEQIQQLMAGMAEIRNALAKLTGEKTRWSVKTVRRGTLK